MSTSDGEKAQASVFNSSYVSREVDDNKVGKLDLENADTGSIIDVQKELNGQASFVGDTTNGADDRKPTWASNAIGAANDDVKTRVDQVQAQVEANDLQATENQTDVAEIRTTTGTADGDTNMGPYTAGSNGFALTNDQPAKTNIQELIDGVDARILLSEKGANNGVAELDANGRVPSSQLALSVAEYQGAWDASTNTPSLADGVGTNGDFYRVSVDGTQDLGSGSIDFFIGDMVLYNGSVWEKIPQAAPFDWSTPVDANIQPDAADSGTYNIGDSNKLFNNVYSELFSAYGAAGGAFRSFTSINQEVFRVEPNSSTNLGISSSVIFKTSSVLLPGARLAINTDANGTANANPTNSIEIATGNKVSGTGGSGDIIMSSGSSLGGQRGKLDLDFREIDVNSKNIVNVLDPVNAQDAATKNYVDLNGGGGSAGKNYFDDADFEAGIDLATLYDDGGAYVDGDGGTATALSISQTAFSIAGNNSLAIDKAGSDATGEGVTLLTTDIDVIDLGKPLYFSLAIDANDTNYATDDVRLKAYDVTNSEILALIPLNNLTDNAGIYDQLRTVTGRILTNPTTAQVRLSLHVETDSSPGLSWTLTVDEARIGPDAPLPSTFVTADSVYFTAQANPTASGGLTNGVASTLIWGVGSVEHDTAGGYNTSTGEYTVQVAGYYDVSASVNLTGSYANNGVTRLSIRVNGTEVRENTSTNTSSGGANNSGHVHTQGLRLEVGDVLTIAVEPNNWSSVSIAGAATRQYFTISKSVDVSSNLISTNELANLDGYLELRSQVPTGTLGASFNDVIFAKTPGSIDRNNQYNESNGEFKVLEDGWYSVNAALEIQGSASANINYLSSCSVFLNGTRLEDGLYSRVFTSSGSMGHYPKCSHSFFAQKNDIIKINSWTNMPSPIYTAGFGASKVSIRLISDKKQFGTYGEFEVLSTESAVKTPVASNVYSQMTGNELVLPRGTWKLFGQWFGTSSGGSPAYTQIVGGWFSANGNDTVTVPSSLASAPGLTILSALPFNSGVMTLGPTLTSSIGQPTMTYIVRVTQETSVYLVPRFGMSTPANARIYTLMTAERLQ